MHDSPATAIWMGLTLWGAACLGELRLLGQATYACALWAALFTLPLTYTVCRTALDALVAEGLALAAQVLGPGMPCPAPMFSLPGGLVCRLAAPSLQACCDAPCAPASSMLGCALGAGLACICRWDRHETAVMSQGQASAGLSGCVLGSAEHRGVAGLAGLAGLFMASLVSVSWVVKASVGALTCTGIVVWRCYAQPGGLGRLDKSFPEQSPREVI